MTILYYRTVRDGVTYIVTGGGGAPPYRPENRQIACLATCMSMTRTAPGMLLSEAQYKH